MDSARRVPRPTLDQVAGAILGLAVGDAVGSVVEAQPPEVARGYVEEVLLPGRLPARGRESYPFGQVTDDTQLTRELLLSIGEDGALDPDLFADRLLHLVVSGALVGGGPASFAAARRLAIGVPWHEAGMPAPYAGNGAAMRAAPLGVLYGREPRLLTRIVADQARVTHQDSRAAAGALAIAVAAAIAARREPVRPANFLLEVSQQVAALDQPTALTLGTLADWVELSPGEALTVFRVRGLAPQASRGWQGISSHVTGSVCWSLYAFLRSPDGYWDAVCTAIAVGGDSDTLAAMTGGIAGARLGTDAVPAQYRERLTDRGAWPAQELIALAATAHGRVSRSFP
jgi:ADP-ribosylglycohydrolase